MSAITLNELWTQMVALVTTQLGIAIVARVPVLAVDSIPPAVIGGVVLAALLLVFFTTLGLSARLGALRGGGASVAGGVLCSVVATKLLARARRASMRHEPALALVWATP